MAEQVVDLGELGDAPLSDQRQDVLDVLGIGVVRHLPRVVFGALEDRSYKGVDVPGTHPLGLQSSRKEALDVRLQEY